jgi:hypothetical protein
VWNILDSLLRSTPVIDVNIPNASLFPVRCIAWKSLLEDNLLFYSDTDGNINLLDLKDPFISSKIFRVRCKPKGYKVFVPHYAHALCFKQAHILLFQGPVMIQVLYMLNLMV